MQGRGATTAGTAAYRDRFKGRAADGHFREAQGLWLSSIGLGTYLGHHDERTDDSYRAAITRAVELGCNVFDTAANYRFQRSERTIGDSIARLIAEGRAAREEIVITTKGGYLPFDSEPPRGRQEMIDYLDQTFVQPGICSPEDFVQGSHSMAPRYLAHQLDQSLRNLRLETVDVYYIHNPESQFAAVSREEFYVRLRAAFEFLESACRTGGLDVWHGNMERISRCAGQSGVSFTRTSRRDSAGSRRCRPSFPGRSVAIECGDARSADSAESTHRG